MQLQGLGIPLSQLARALGNMLARRAADDTGISGNYDVSLEYAPDEDLLKRVMPDGQPLDNAAPFLFTALQEQLGLRLESHKGLVEVFVVEHAELLSEN
jgi:uncharacterized protein (TIGR03435 family)